ncbi:dephospho-CoA kinase [Candidatus Blochmannia ocreatus]|uniref:Dephospho-CoA kinase n=1 Tax=Candidatus Blochmannia ocreatus (nom. nud.) TaxID=251538 RepID=A0ABY4STC8_9ENTR|nr:dephospho-CoA kinase [Candidatus Blochmannia ocreatus]URJ25229.1 dephospho-CoA kinase [Candidatus Blochmannia ocreatus]
MHPIIRYETQKQIVSAHNKSKYIILVVPLLIENNLQNIADRILVVDAHASIQLNRVINRDKVTLELAKNIIRSQVSRRHRLNYADDVIYNNNSVETIKKRVIILHQNYMKIISQKHSI